jgi:hypothetical protein
MPKFEFIGLAMATLREQNKPGKRFWKVYCKWLSLWYDSNLV